MKLQDIKTYLDGLPDGINIKETFKANEIDRLTEINMKAVMGMEGKPSVKKLLLGIAEHCESTDEFFAVMLGHFSS